MCILIFVLTFFLLKFIIVFSLESITVYPGCLYTEGEFF